MAQQADDEKKADDGNLRDTLVDLLQKSNISDLKLSPKVIVLDAKVKPKQAIEVLIENKIRCLFVSLFGSDCLCCDIDLFLYIEPLPLWYDAVSFMDSVMIAMARFCGDCLH